MPDSAELRQIVFLPTTPEAEAQVLTYTRSGEPSTPEFRWRCDIGAQAYSIVALIPLEKLAIDEGAHEFMMELSVNGSPVDVVHRERLFGSSRPASSTEHYGRMKVAE
jgi:hypothetical protein